MTDEVEPEFKYAVQLSGLDLGATITLAARTEYSMKVTSRTVRKVRRIEHYGPNFGSREKKNTVYIHGLGTVLVAKFDSEAEVVHGK